MTFKRMRVCAFAALALTGAISYAAAETDAANGGPEGEMSAVRAAVASDPGLLTLEPTDIAAYCPNFSTLNAEGRVQFWSSFMLQISNAESHDESDLTHWSALDRDMHRPTFRRGLFQISTEAAHSDRYACAVTAPSDLYDRGANAACAVKILEHNVETSGAVAGAGRYWPSLASPNRRAHLAADLSTRAPCAGAAQELP